MATADSTATRLSPAQNIIKIATITVKDAFFTHLRFWVAFVAKSNLQITTVLKKIQVMYNQASREKKFQNSFSKWPTL